MPEVGYLTAALSMNENNRPKTKESINSSGREDVVDFQNTISRLQKQLEAANRKIANANHRSDAHEKHCKDVESREQQSRREAEQSRNELARMRERYHNMEQDLQINKLRNECSVNRANISSIGAMIQEIESDPSMNLPSRVDQKRKLPKMKLELQRLRSKHESQSQLLENLEAMGNLNEVMQKAAVRDDKLMVKRLLSRGVNVNIQDETGYSAFMYACGQGHSDTVGLMITSGGAAVNDFDSKLTPLILAATNGHDDTIQILVDNGAAIDQRDELSRTPLLIACEKGNIGCARVLLKAGANANAMDKRGNTGLHHCAVHGNDEFARLLIDHGVNDAVKNNDLMTALVIARSRRHFKVVDVIATKK